MSHAVLLLAHGTPNVLGEMAEYLSKVTGGRTIPDAVVEELKHRYAQIGLKETPGAEPPTLTRWTFAQGDALEKLLGETPVYIAMRNWSPYIADVVEQMRADGVTSIRAICLAPQNSRTSVGLYRRALMAAAAGIEIEFVADWAENPLLIQAFAEKLLPVWLQGTAELGKKPPVLFTAHSVPCRTIMTGEASIAGARPGTPMQDTPDPYPVEAKRTAALVAEQLALQGLTDRDWYFAFQSQGVSGGPWIGPTVEDTLRALRQEGHTGVILQPVGFVCDHVEVLYDIDIAFKQLASELGLKLWRAESLNDSHKLTQALAEIAKAALPAASAEGAPAKVG
jgi:ferrochelatase